MFIKIHKSYRTVVALCDKEILGRKFEEGKFQLNVRENFYKGEEITKEQAIRIMKQQAALDATFNIAGNKAIQTAIEVGLVSKEGIGYISNIPYALVLL